MNIDLHVHTKASACSSFEALKLAWSARVEGHPVVVTTNHHDEGGDAKELFQECARFGILYLPALEMTTEWGDFLLFGENLEDFRGTRTHFPVDLLPRPDVAVVWAHPYEFITSRYVDSIKSDVAPYIDAVEVLNGSHECMSRSKQFRKGIRANEQARGLAAELGRPSVAGSDAHQGRHYFTAWTVFPEAVTCYGDLVRALKEGRVHMPELPLYR